MTRYHHSSQTKASWSPPLRRGTRVEVTLLRRMGSLARRFPARRFLARRRMGFPARPFTALAGDGQQRQPIANSKATVQGRPRQSSDVSRTSQRRARAGITLLEIVLSLALLAIATSLLAQLVSLGTRAATAARDQSKAQLLCASIMAEIVSGSLPAQATSWTPSPTDASWLYQVSTGTTPSETVIAVQVSVQRAAELPRSSSFSLSRWMIDPLTSTTSTSGSGL